MPSSVQNQRLQGDFLVLPGDNYIDPQSIARIKDIPNAILVKEHPNPSNFGVVLLNNGLVTDIVEKPEHSPSFMVSTGIYSLKKTFFSYIRGNDITDAIPAMIAAGEQIRAIPADDWQDAIFAWDLLKMNRRLLKNLPMTREGTASRQTIIQGPVSIGKGTTIGPNTVITGPVVIGNDCTIGPNCVHYAQYEHRFAGESWIHSPWSLVTQLLWTIPQSDHIPVLSTP